MHRAKRHKFDMSKDSRNLTEFEKVQQRVPRFCVSFHQSKIDLNFRKMPRASRSIKTRYQQPDLN